MTDKVHRLPLATFNTRRNLPAAVGRKRGESNFLRAFERVYFARQTGGMAIGEFALGGFGVARFGLDRMETAAKRRILYGYLVGKAAFP